MAQPVGASVIAGQAQVSTSGATTFVNQSTDKAIINWQDFSVAQGAAVQFNQLSASSIILNRVTGSGISAINGAIRADGQVWLLNPNGMLFGNNATINVGGLLATTSDITNQDFLEGRYNFSGGHNGIVNNGVITASSGGSVILSAPNVVNNGLIQANAGHVVLGGTDTFTVDFNGDHLLSYAVGSNSAGGKVTNTGKISAAGGQVMLTARAASGVRDAVINNTGMVEATSVREENGEIILEADDGGVANSGTLDASGKDAGETGGTVKVLGKDVAIADGATIDVSGDAGGGTALIGGNFHGGGSEVHAQNTKVGKVSIEADAISKGNGGKVAVWSDGTTDFAGSISARGGAVGGNGGQVETSGENLHILSGATVDALSPHGFTGGWLLDPANIDIEPTGVSAVGGETFASNNFSGTSTIQATTIDTALQTADLSLQASNDITVNAAVTINSAGTVGRTLTLEAGRSIVLNESISYAGGAVVMIAESPNVPFAYQNYRGTFPAFISSGSISGTIQAARIDFILSSNGVDGSLIGSAGTPFIVQASSPTFIKTLGANAYLSVPDGTATSFALGNSANTNAVDLGTGSLSIRAAGVTQSAPVLLNNLTITLPNSISSGNPVILDNAQNAIAGTVNISAMGGSPFSGTDYVKVVNSQSLTIGAITDTPDINSTDRGSMTLQALVGNLTLTGNIDIGLATLNGANNVTQSAGVLYSHATTGGAGGAAVNAGGAISLPDANILEHTIAATGNGSETAVTNIGQLAFVSGTDATLNFAQQVRLQAAIAGSALSVTTTGSYSLQDVSNNPVTVYNAIDIYNPVTAAGLITLHAAGDIRQQVTASTDVHITTGTGLIATSDNGLLQLADGGHGVGTNCNLCTADAGNQVSGYGLFNSPGNTNFTNTISTTIGIPGSDSPQTSVIGGNLDVEVTDANQNVAENGHATLTMNGRVHTQQSVVSGDTVLHAAGDLINNNGNGTIIATNLSLVSDNGTVGAGSWTFGDGTDGNGILNIHASAPNGGVVINPGNLNIGTDLAGPGVQAQYVSIFGNGTITQNADSTGTIVAGSLDAHAAAAITLNNLNNAAGTVAFTTASDVVFNNSVATTINRGNADHDINGNQLPAGNIDIEVADPSDETSPGIFVQGNSVTDSIESTGTVLLHAAGAITSSTNPIIASTVRLLSDTGAVGTASAPMLVTANTLIATTSNQDIMVAAKALNATLTIGDGTTGINAGTGNVALIADSAAVTGTTTITANNLRVSGATITLADVEVSTLNARTGGGDIDITSDAGFQIANITGAPGAAGIDAGGGNVRLIAGSAITQASGDGGKILAGGLVADPANPRADINLDNTANQVTGMLSLVGTNNVSFTNSVTTHIGTSSAGGSLRVISAGDLEIVAGATLTSGAAGDAIVLAAGGHFINNAGANVLAMGGNGRFLIYSADPAGDVFGNLDSQNTAIFSTSYPSGIASTGNHYVFALTPTLTLSARNATKIYGVDNSASLQNGYTISGVQSGVAGAYLADSAANFSGAPSITSAGASTTAGVGVYKIVVGTGSLVANGYLLAFQNSTLTVTPQTLVYTANAATRTYGAADPAYGGKLTGFVNGDTLASATSGTLVFVSAAAATSPVGIYGVNGAGLSAANYIFVQAASNASALTIMPATLLYVANAAARTVGAANPAFSGTVTGFVNADSLTSATSGALVFTTTATATSGTGGYALNGSGLSAANYIFAQSPANATAFTVRADTSLPDTSPLPGTLTTALIGFTAAIQPPPVNSPLNSPVGNSQNLPPPAPPLPPPPPPVPPGSSPLAANNTAPDGQPAEAPNSSDGATSQVADSLEGGAAEGGGGPVIPKMLASAPPAGPPPTDASALSSFGNSALWQ